MNDGQSGGAVKGHLVTSPEGSLASDQERERYREALMQIAGLSHQDVDEPFGRLLGRVHKIARDATERAEAGSGPRLLVIELLLAGETHPADAEAAASSIFEQAFVNERVIAGDYRLQQEATDA